MNAAVRFDEPPALEEDCGPGQLPAGQLSGSDVRRYVTAGNSRFTIRSAKTGQRFTFRVRAKDDGAIFFVSLLSGSDNESDYRYIGFIRSGVFFHGGAKSFAKKEAPSVIAFGWFWKNVDGLSGCDVFHDGRCGRCGRSLTVPESVASGLGPECAGKMGGG